MLVTEQEVKELKKFITHLNSIREGAVVVEGKKDVDALKKIGYTGTILEYQKFGGMNKFADFASKYETIIVLFDRDKKGRELTGKIIKLLQRRTKVNLSFKRELRLVTRGKVKHIEQLRSYESYLS